MPTSSSRPPLQNGTLPDESAWIIGTHYYVKIEALQVDLSQGEPYFDVTIPNLHSQRKWLPTVYNFFYVWGCLQKATFSRQSVKLIIKLCLILRAGPTEIWNQDPRPLSNSFRCPESNGSVRIDKRASVENHIFQDKHYCLSLCEFSIS